MTQPLRNRISKRRLYGPAYPQIDCLRRRIARSPAPTYVYRTKLANEIELANHEIPGRTDLLAVYDRSVTNGMLREDLYGEDGEET